MKKFLKICLCFMVFCVSFSLCGCSLFGSTPSTDGNVSSGLDADDTVTLTGGTFIYAGAFSHSVSTDLKSKSWSDSTFASGTYAVAKSGSEIFSFELTDSYTGLYIYSSEFGSGSYILTSSFGLDMTFKIS